MTASYWKQITFSTAPFSSK